MDMSASSSNFSYKTLNSLKKDQLIKLILEQQKDASKSECFTDGADSLNTSSRVLSPNAHSSDLMSVSTVKSFIVDAVRELKEELTLDFNQRFSSLSEEVTRLRSDVDIFSKEFYTYREAIKADLLSELKKSWNEERIMPSFLVSLNRLLPYLKTSRIKIQNFLRT